MVKVLRQVVLNWKILTNLTSIPFLGQCTQAPGCQDHYNVFGWWSFHWPRDYSKKYLMTSPFIKLEMIKSWTSFTSWIILVNSTTGFRFICLMSEIVVHLKKFQAPPPKSAPIIGAQCPPATKTCCYTSKEHVTSLGSKCVPAIGSPLDSGWRQGCRENVKAAPSEAESFQWNLWVYPQLRCYSELPASIGDRELCQPTQFCSFWVFSTSCRV